jgi:glycosyltransferase involved in cell wall biosynthesis
LLAPQGAEANRKVAVIIPALDEETAISSVLAALPPTGWVIVVDNGSRDRTAEVARSKGAFVLVEPRRGYGSACKRGIAEALRMGAEVIVILDADHSDDPTLLHRLVDPVLGGQCDIAQSERTRTAAPGALLPHQRAGNAFAVWLIHKATGRRYSDMGPFRAISADALHQMNMEDPTWGWNVEMAVKAARLGLRVMEIPLPYNKRTVGVSKISGTLVGTARAGARILQAVVKYRISPLKRQGQ